MRNAPKIFTNFCCISDKSLAGDASLSSTFLFFGVSFFVLLLNDVLALDGLNVFPLFDMNVSQLSFIQT
ncbi:hypothetical protein D3C86_1728990 [compost metagenome]